CFFIEGMLSISNTSRWVALWIFVIASLTDFLDGYLARILNQTSNIGRMLDPIAAQIDQPAIVWSAATSRRIEETSSLSAIG
ncbi:CDP-alcohol phosphatidyltransferase family protein, partial [Rhizobium ruizarguesonis]